MRDYADSTNGETAESKITAEWLSELRFLSALTSAPGQKRAAFIVKQADLNDNGYNSWLWLLEDNKTRCLTRIYKESSFVFLDEETILFPDRRRAADKGDRNKNSVQKSDSDASTVSIRDKGENENKDEGAERADCKNHKDQDNYTQFYRLSIADNQVAPAFELPFSCKEFLALSDCRYLLLADIDIERPELWRERYENTMSTGAAADSDSPGESEDAAVSAGSDSAGEGEDFTAAAAGADQNCCLVLDEIPYRRDNLGYSQGKRAQLFLYDEKSLEIKTLTAPELDVRDIMLHPQRSGVLFRANDRSGEYRCRANLCDDIYELDPETLELKPLYQEKDLNIGKVFYWHNQVYALASDMKEYGLNQNYRLYRIDQKQSILLGSEEIILGNTVGSDIRLGKANNFSVLADKVFYLSTLEGEGVLKLLDKQGESKLFLRGPGSVDSFIFVDGSLYVAGLFADRPQEIYQLKPDDAGQTERTASDLLRITHFNDAAMAGITPSSPVKLEIESNGDIITGWVLLPERFDPLESYPGILCIHGGPKTVYGTALFHEMQLWAGEGYIVYFCNPHGSDGRGDIFSDIRGKYGTIDFHDLMNFTDAVLEKYPQLDEDRLGVSGGSYGGFMTNWIISHTDRFRAAVTQRSISNWLSFYGTSDIGYYFAEDQMAADFFSQQGIKQLWKFSPLHYAKEINTPLLIIHSEEDYRCSPEQGYQLFTALKVRGIDSKMVVFKGESHELSRSGRPLARIERLKQITQWFNSYLQS